MDRRQLLERIDKEWRALNESWAGLPEPELDVPGATGDWSVKDLIGHITSWEQETLKALPLIMSGKPLPRYASQGGIDAFNAGQRAEKLHLSRERLARESAETHERLLRFLESVPETWFAGESRFRRRLRLDTYSHYREHAEMVMAWRKARGTSEPGEDEV